MSSHPADCSDLVTSWSSWSSQLDFAVRALGAQFAQSLHANVAQEQSPCYTADDIRSAANDYPAKKALGCDSSSVTDFRNAPTAALELFATILNTAVDFIA